MIVVVFRVLTTPTEDLWPGVSTLPDYTPNFPEWTDFNLKAHVKNLDDDGLDLLQKMLVYNPAERISAKKIAQHPYLVKNLNKSVLPVFKD